LRCAGKWSCYSPGCGATTSGKPLPRVLRDAVVGIEAEVGSGPGHSWPAGVLAFEKLLPIQPCMVGQNSSVAWWGKTAQFWSEKLLPIQPCMVGQNSSVAWWGKTAQF
jgi:hypothetical protein